MGQSEELVIKILIREFNCFPQHHKSGSPDPTNSLKRLLSIYWQKRLLSHSDGLAYAQIAFSPTAFGLDPNTFDHLYPDRVDILAESRFELMRYRVVGEEFWETMKLAHSRVSQDYEFGRVYRSYAVYRCWFVLVTEYARTDRPGVGRSYPVDSLRGWLEELYGLCANIRRELGVDIGPDLESTITQIRLRLSQSKTTTQSNRLIDVSHSNLILVGLKDWLVGDDSSLAVFERMTTCAQHYLYQLSFRTLVKEYRVAERPGRSTETSYLEVAIKAYWNTRLEFDNFEPKHFGVDSFGGLDDFLREVDLPETQVQSLMELHLASVHTRPVHGVVYNAAMGRYLLQRSLECFMTEFNTEQRPYFWAMDNDQVDYLYQAFVYMWKQNIVDGPMSFEDLGLEPVPEEKLVYQINRWGEGEMVKKIVQNREKTLKGHVYFLQNSALYRPMNLNYIDITEVITVTRVWKEAQSHHPEDRAAMIREFDIYLSVRRAIIKRNNPHRFLVGVYDGGMYMTSPDLGVNFMEGIDVGREAKVELTHELFFGESLSSIADAEASTPLRSIGDRSKIGDRPLFMLLRGRIGNSQHLFETAQPIQLNNGKTGDLTAYGLVEIRHSEREFVALLRLTNWYSNSMEEIRLLVTLQLPISSKRRSRVTPQGAFIADATWGRGLLGTTRSVARGKRYLRSLWSERKRWSRDRARMSLMWYGRQCATGAASRPTTRTTRTAVTATGTEQQRLYKTLLYQIVAKTRKGSWLLWFCENGSSESVVFAEPTIRIARTNDDITHRRMPGARTGVCTGVCRVPCAEPNCTRPGLD